MWDVINWTTFSAANLHHSHHGFFSLRSITSDSGGTISINFTSFMITQQSTDFADEQ
jgi:hypothetical protein